MNIRIILFYWSRFSLMSWLIMLVTGCQFTHAALQMNGEMYDASETRGYFGKLDINKFSNRPCIITEFKADETAALNWLSTMRGKPYDYKGVLGWFFCRWVGQGCGKTQHFYCFEAINSALVALCNKGIDRPALSGCDLYHALPADRWQWLKLGD